MKVGRQGQQHLEAPKQHFKNNVQFVKFILL